MGGPQRRAGRRPGGGTRAPFRLSGLSQRQGLSNHGPHASTGLYPRHLNKPYPRPSGGQRPQPPRCHQPTALQVQPAPAHCTTPPPPPPSFLRWSMAPTTPVPSARHPQSPTRPRPPCRPAPRALPRSRAGGTCFSRRGPRAGPRQCAHTRGCSSRTPPCEGIPRGGRGRGKGRGGELGQFEGRSKAGRKGGEGGGSLKSSLGQAGVLRLQGRVQL